MMVILSKNFDERTQIIGFILLKIGRDDSSQKRIKRKKKKILTYAVKQVRKNAPIPMSIFKN